MNYGSLQRHVVVSAEVVPMVAFENANVSFVLTHEIDEDVQVRVAVRRVRQDEDTGLESREHVVKGLDRRPAIREWREPFWDLLHLCR